MIYTCCKRWRQREHDSFANKPRNNKQTIADKPNKSTYVVGYLSRMLHSCTSCLFVASALSAPRFGVFCEGQMSGRPLSARRRGVHTQVQTCECNVL